MPQPIHGSRLTSRGYPALAGQAGHRVQHRVGPAGVEPDGPRGPLQVGREGHRDPAPLAEAAVVGGGHERNPERLEPVAELQVGGGAPAVEDPAASPRPSQLLAEQPEGRDSVAARHHHRLGAGGGRGEGPAQRAQALGRLALAERAEGAAAVAHRLDEERERLAARVDGQDREGPAQRRLGGGAGLDHHELAGPGLARRLRGGGRSGG